MLAPDIREVGFIASQPFAKVSEEAAWMGYQRQTEKRCGPVLTDGYRDEDRSPKPGDGGLVCSDGFSAEAELQKP